MATEAPVSVFVAVFRTRGQADATIDTLKRLQKSGAVEIIDAAEVSKKENGKVHVDEVKDLTVKKGGLRGAAVGAVIGLIFPPSIIAGALAGGVLGGAWGKLRDTGFKTDELKQIADDLSPNDVAVVAVVEDRWVSQLEVALQGYDQLIKQGLDARAAAVLTADPVTGDVAVGAFTTEVVSGESATAASSSTPVATGDAAVPTTPPATEDSAGAPSQS
jgi:uncharacterized membrane protein